MEDDYDPLELFGVPRDRRVDWHVRRVMRQQAAYEFLDSIHHEELDEIEDVRFELEIVREEIAEVEAAIAALESQEISRLTNELADTVKSVKFLMAERAQILTDQFKKSNARTDSNERRLRLLKAAEAVQIRKAEEVEDQIKRACEMLKVDPVPFLMLQEVRRPR